MIPDDIRHVLIYVVTRVYVKNWSMDEIMRGIETEDTENYVMFKAAFPKEVEIIENGLKKIEKEIGR